MGRLDLPDPIRDEDIYVADVERRARGIAEFRHDDPDEALTKLLQTDEEGPT